MKRNYKPKWYKLAAQIIAGEQPRLEEVMLDIFSDTEEREIESIDDLEVGLIVEWLECSAEMIQPFIR